MLAKVENLTTHNIVINSFLFISAAYNIVSLKKERLTILNKLVNLIISLIIYPISLIRLYKYYQRIKKASKVIK